MKIFKDITFLNITDYGLDLYGGRKTLTKQDVLISHPLFKRKSQFSIEPSNCIIMLKDLEFLSYSNIELSTIDDNVFILADDILNDRNFSRNIGPDINKLLFLLLLYNLRKKGGIS
jgi:hypothetical protein